jgi:hypothetical protein
LKFVPPYMDPVLARFLKLIKDFARLFDIRPFPFDAKPAIASGYFHCQLFLKLLQQLEIVGVQILERSRVIELKRLGFNH